MSSLISERTAKNGIRLILAAVLAVAIQSASKPGPVRDAVLAGQEFIEIFTGPITLPGGGEVETGYASGQAGQPYERSLYGAGWIRQGPGCTNLRADILAEMSTGPVHMRESGCSVDRGKWFDPYTGMTLTQAADIDIDHLVPLAWAHSRGADAWDSNKKIEFANWKPNLIPVLNSINREKGASGPLQWLPPRIEYRCEYILRFERVVLTWELRQSPNELAGMETLKAHYCPGPR